MRRERPFGSSATPLAAGALAQAEQAIQCLFVDYWEYKPVRYGIQEIAERGKEHSRVSRPRETFQVTGFSSMKAVTHCQ